MTSILSDTSTDMRSSFISNEFESKTPSQSLTSSSLEREYDSVENLKVALNENIKLQDYAVVISDSQKSSHEVKNKIYIRCTREEKSRSSKSTDKRSNTDSTRIECSFLIVAELNEDNDKWILQVIVNLNHNHLSAETEIFSVHRQTFKCHERTSRSDRKSSAQTSS